MSEKDTIKATASASSTSLEITGPGAASATQALVDLLSPFANAAGWLGDQLSYARRTAAIRAAKKASEQLKEEGITTAQVPPKILLPWLEGASLEIDEKDSLTDAWAGLFVRAAKSSDAVIVSYIETLKRLGKVEAELLSFFATDLSPSYTEKFYDSDVIGIFSESNPLKNDLLKPVNELVKKGATIAELRDLMEHWGLQGMCQVVFFSIGEARMVATKYFEKNQHAISNLEHLGLISVKHSDFDTRGGNLNVVWFEITKYAFDLMWACLGRPTGKRSVEQV